MTKQVQITTWAPEGTTPTFVPGRWVQLGRPTLLNYWLTGLPGGKVYFSKSWPWVRYERNRTRFDNHATAWIDPAALTVPSGFGADGWVKTIYGQRRISTEFAEWMMKFIIKEAE